MGFLSLSSQHRRISNKSPSANIPFLYLSLHSISRVQQLAYYFIPLHNFPVFYLLSCSGGKGFPGARERVPRRFATNARPPPPLSTVGSGRKRTTFRKSRSLSLCDARRPPTKCQRSTDSRRDPIRPVAVCLSSPNQYRGEEGKSNTKSGRRERRNKEARRGNGV